MLASRLSKRLRLLSAALLASCSASIDAPSSAAVRATCRPPVDSAPSAVRWDNGGHLCYLGALEENIVRLETASPDDREIIIGDIAVYLSMLGEDAGVRHAIAAMADERSAPAGQAPDVEGIRGAEARDEILKRAASTRVVIINEAHHVSRHRDFVRQLLPGLRALGYTHLAAEGLAFDLPPAKANSHSPDQSFGFYIRDPAYARLLRDARGLGFTIVPYDAAPQSPGLDRVTSMQVRERSQAQTLLARTVDGNENARLIALVGYDHVEENARRRSDGKGDFYWMAAEFKRLSGIDLLTIDQTTLNPEGKPRLESPFYRPLLSELAPTSSVVLVNDNGPVVLGRFKGRVDLQVLHPADPLIKGREKWRWSNARPIWPKLPRSASAQPRLFLAQARPADAGDSIPLDQAVTSAAAPVPLLVPRSARVRVVLTPIAPAIAKAIQEARGGGEALRSALHGEPSE
ncbi:MAG TPA: hypothetical protein VFZ91_03265 [Allosphingosinicella sp.]